MAEAMADRNLRVFWNHLRGASKASLGREHGVTAQRIREIVDRVRYDRLTAARRRETAFLSTAIPEINWWAVVQYNRERTTLSVLRRSSEEEQQ